MNRKQIVTSRQCHLVYLGSVIYRPSPKISRKVWQMHTREFCLSCCLHTLHQLAKSLHFGTPSSFVIVHFSVAFHIHQTLLCCCKNLKMDVFSPLHTAHLNCFRARPRSRRKMPYFPYWAPNRPLTFNN